MLVLDYVYLRDLELRILVLPVTELMDFDLWNT